MNSNTTYEFSVLKEELNKKIATIDLSNRPVEKSNIAIHVVHDYIGRLKNLKPQEFSSAEAEVNFFRNIIPHFHGELIFFAKVFQLESTLPNSESIRRRRFAKERKLIARYYANNVEAYQYFKTDDDTLDTVLFKSCSPFSTIGVDESLMLADFDMCTPTGLKFARFIAYRRLEDYLAFQMRKEEATNKSSLTKLKWTDKKTHLQELTYALVYSNSINNGNIDVKSLARLFESIFDIDLSNIYRSKQEMYIRKDTTAYLNKLIQGFKRGLDDSDDRNNYDR